VNIENVEYLDHMTDAHVRCVGKTLGEAFELSAKGLLNIMFDIAKIKQKQKYTLHVIGFDLENLLYNWLEKVLLMFLIDKKVMSSFNILVIFDKDSGSYILRGYGKGEPFDIEKHGLDVEVKGITYHEMKIVSNTVTNRSSAIPTSSVLDPVSSHASTFQGDDGDVGYTIEYIVDL
jgi:SHS2 domain-containing protein